MKLNNTYFLRFFADTSFSIGHRSDHVSGKSATILISSPDWQIACYEQLIEIDGRFVFSGLSFDSYIEVKSIEEAKKTINIALFNILNMLGFSCLAPWKNLRIIEAYDASTELSSRQFQAHFYPTRSTEITKTIRVLDLDLFSKIQSEFAKSSYQQAILSSQYQLDKALQSETDVDEFIAYWTGIEYLANSLNKNKGFEKVERFYTCPNCGNQLSECKSCKGELAKHNTGVATYKRVEEIAQEQLGLSHKDFNSIADTRHVIIHGGSWDNFKNSNKYKNLTRRLQILCIGELLNISIDEITELVNKDPIIRNSTTTEPIFLYQANITGLDEIPNIFNFSDQPKVEITDTIEKPLKINKDGSVNISATNTYTHIGNGEIKWNNISQTLLIHSASGVKKMNLEFEK